MMASHTSSGLGGIDNFDKFVEMNFPSVYRFTFCMSLAHESAADLTQNAFAKAQYAQLHVTDGSCAKRWLLAALHHEWAGRGAPVGGGEPAESSSFVGVLIEPMHVAGLDQADVLYILHGMKKNCGSRWASNFERLSYGEIAEILEMPPEAVLSHLAEAKTVLRRELEGDRKEPADRPRVSATKGKPGG